MKTRNCTESQWKVKNHRSQHKKNANWQIPLYFSEDLVDGQNINLYLCASKPTYGVHLRTKIIENKRQFEAQKLDYPCRNLVIWIWNRNEGSRNSIIRTWSYFEQVEIIKAKLDIADVEVQITIPTKMQITWFELQFTLSTLTSHLIVNNAAIIFRKIPNETFNLNLKSRHIFEFEKPKFQFERKRK